MNEWLKKNWAGCGCGCGVVLFLALIACLVIGVLFWHPWSRTNASTDPQNPLAFAQADTCVGITANADQSYVEKTLVPGQTFAGDIEIQIDGNWVQVHDSGIGEYTVVRNTGTTDILTRGRWGAGCLLEVNQEIVVNGEFDNPNHGDLVAVRDVEVKNGSYSETYFNSPLP